MAKNADLKAVFLSLIDVAESGDVRGASFASRMSGPILGLIAHNVAKNAKAGTGEAPAPVEAVEAPAPVEAVEAPAPVEAVEAPAAARGSRARATAN